ncbi:ClpP-like prohead protease/major capsid protein fusion protein [Bosea sp. BK604]|uniref:ClpP-like prohead protease/major capsid protein fusion protein n=1 Tax=Bosea sp. BK604 TaxID=2512180 RepID=UPI001052E3BF|nr:ClpP-like prohead protease/major capsid protein fusion protein [Bosea sp. BK604]TCR60948.1 ATP-dependent protease ClpP protease subunit [Bosea sp. BK604]
MPNDNRSAAPAAGTQTRAERRDTRSLVINGEILLYGVIDPFDYLCEFSQGIRALDVMASLVELSSQPRISVRINSPGGAVMEGLAIYNALVACGKPVDVHIDAMAASIASVIAMAGETITMAENASIMIHDVAGGAWGSSEDLRDMADEIDRQRGIVADIYSRRTGIPADEMNALMMAGDTYFSAQEAVEKGFATAVAEPMRTAACALLTSAQLVSVNARPTTIRADRPDQAAPAASHQGADMPQDNRGGSNAAETVNADAIRQEATQAERARVQSITANVRAARLDLAFADELVREGLTVDQANTRIINRFSEQQEQAEGNGTTVNVDSRIHVGADASDRWAEGARLGLLTRASQSLGASLMTDEERTAARNNEFVGLTLSELARSYLSSRNIRSGTMNRMDMVGRAFTTRNAAGLHSTSDFPSILANTAYRALQNGYAEVDETFDRFTARGTASDFRPISRIDLNLFPGLDKVEEGGEYKYGTIGDSGVTVQIATYGKIFAITRQAIINDDLGMITRIPQRMGRAAKRTIGNLVFAIINGNPTMQDGTALFHANHGNLLTGAALSADSLDTARAAMAKQKDPDNIAAALNISPRFLLVPVALGGKARQIMASQTEPGQNNAALANRVAGMAEVIADARLDASSATAWYLAADANSTDTIEVTYLDGNDTPFMDQKDGWSVDGTEFKVRLDAGVKALHWRGLSKNPGA